MKIYCFAGPNGSGKTTTITKFLEYNFLKDLPFVNADIIAKAMFSHIQDNDTRNLAAAQFAEEKRKQLLMENKDFMFETVLSTPRNLEFLKEAKKQGATIDTIYVLTRDKEININRVRQRVSEGGHPVPEDKIRQRYDRCMKILPDLIATSDTVMIYDNSLDHQTSIMFHKNNNKAIIFSNNAKEDVFLQKTLIKPLESKFNYSFVYCDTANSSFNKINIFSGQDLNGFIQQVDNDLNTVHKKTYKNIKN